MTPRPANILSAEGALPAIWRTRRPRLSWLRALPPLARTMPWVALITGCLVGTVFLAVLDHRAATSRGRLLT